MFSRKHLLSYALAGMFACVAATASAQATVTNQPVYFTFDKSVVVPGTTLPAGEYEFKLATTRGGDREVVEIYNRQTGKHVVTVGAIGTNMSDLQGVPEKPSVRFYEASANTPAAVRNWWYPGIHGGHEFIYSRAEAQGFARLNADGVLIAEGDSTTRFTDTTQVAAAVEAAPAPEPTPAPAPAPVRVETPAPEERMVEERAEPAPTPEPAPAPTMAQADVDLMAQPVRETLPRTASVAPVVTAIGLLSLFAGVALARRRSA